MSILSSIFHTGEARDLEEPSQWTPVPAWRRGNVANVQPFSYPSKEVLLGPCGPEVCFSLNSMFWGFPNGVSSMVASLFPCDGN